MFVTYGSGFQKVIGVFFGLCFRDVLLYVFVEPDRLMQIDSLELIKIDIVINVSELLLLVLCQNIESLLLWDQSVAQKA